MLIDGSEVKWKEKDEVDKDLQNGLITSGSGATG